MAALTTARRFELLNALLAMAEERKGVFLDEAAAALDTDEAMLRELLEPVLLLDFRLRQDGQGEPKAMSGEIIDHVHAFELSEDGWLTVNDEHWLRDMAAEPPNGETALRLFVAATVATGTLGVQHPALDAAMAKLEQLVRSNVVVTAVPPPMLELVRRAHRDGRTLKMRYVAGVDDIARDREIEPHRVYSKWGRWYVLGRRVGETELLAFRVDRIVSAELGDETFAWDDDSDPPEWFDLEHLATRLTVDVDEAQVALLDAAYEVHDVQPKGDGARTVDLTVLGEARGDHLLLRLGAGADLDDASLVERRRALARTVLERYGATG